MGWFRRRAAASPAAADQVAPQDPGEMTVEDEAYAQAEAFLDTLEEVGAPVGRAALDYTVASLEALDHLLGEFHDHGVEAPDEMIEGAGCYLMGVARREHGGTYQTAGEDDPLVLVVVHDLGQVGMFAISKVRGRVANGSEDNLPFFYAGFRQAVLERRSATIT